MNADTTVMMPYGTRIPVRTKERPNRILYITMAKAKPSTSSTPTLTTVMISVVVKSDHHTGSVSTVVKFLSPTKVLPPGSVNR
jgi:hypothetical protein